MMQLHHLPISAADRTVVITEFSDSHCQLRAKAVIVIIITPTIASTSRIGGYTCC
jgi:hypothetical protein